MAQVKTDPIDALDHAISMAFFSSAPHRPGEVVNRLSPEVREALKRLTSDQARSMRLAL